MNKKRLILALGATASVAAPIAATISCTAWDDKSVVKESAYTFSVDGVKKSLGQFGHALIREHTITAGQKIGVGTHTFEMTDDVLKQFAAMGSGDQAKALELVGSLAGLDSTDATGYANAFNEELGTGHGGQQIDPANIKAGATAAPVTALTNPTTVANTEVDLKTANPVYLEKPTTGTPADRQTTDKLVDSKTAGYILDMISEETIPASIKAGFEKYADKHGTPYVELRKDEKATAMYFVITKDMPSDGLKRGDKVTLKFVAGTQATAGTPANGGTPAVAGTPATADSIEVSFGKVTVSTVVKSGDKGIVNADLVEAIKAMTTGANGIEAFVQTYFEDDGKSHNFHTMFAQWKHNQKGYEMKPGDFWRVEYAEGKFASMVISQADVDSFNKFPKAVSKETIAPQIDGANALQTNLLDRVAEIIGKYNPTLDVEGIKTTFHNWLAPASQVAGHGYAAPVEAADDIYN